MKSVTTTSQLKILEMTCMTYNLKNIKSVKECKKKTVAVKRIYKNTV